jgi:hypothetical protein
MTKDVHVKLRDREYAAIVGMAAAEDRSLNHMVRVLVSEALELRKEKEEQERSARGK